MHKIAQIELAATNAFSNFCGLGSCMAKRMEYTAYPKLTQHIVSSNCSGKLKNGASCPLSANTKQPDSNAAIPSIQIRVFNKNIFFAR